MLKGRKTGNAAEQMEELRKENKELRNKLKEFNTLNNTQSQSIIDMQKDIDEYKDHLKKKNEHIRDLNQLIENKDIKIEKLERLKEVINEENEQLTNEYSNKLIIAEQEINRLNTEVACLKAFKEKADKRIQHLINAIKNTAAAL